MAKSWLPDQRGPAPAHHQIHAFDRVRTIADDIAQADHVLHAAPLDLGQHGGEGFQVPVNVADNCKHGVNRVGKRRPFPRRPGRLSAAGLPESLIVRASGGERQFEPMSERWILACIRTWAPRKDNSRAQSRLRVPETRPWRRISSNGYQSAEISQTTRTFARHRFLAAWLEVCSIVISSQVTIQVLNSVRLFEPWLRGSLRPASTLILHDRNTNRAHRDLSPRGRRRRRRRAEDPGRPARPAPPPDRPAL